MTKIVLKESNEPNGYWVSSPIERAEFDKFMKGFKEGKTHKHTYVNSRNTTFVIEGSKADQIYTYPESDPTNKRLLTAVDVTPHKGRDKTDGPKRPMSSGKKSNSRPKSRPKSRSRR